MKIIGVEIRFGVEYYNSPRLVEVKLVPVEAVYPVLLSRPHPHIRPAANFTIHTSLGDVTSGDVLLPQEAAPIPRGLNLEQDWQKIDEALQEFAAQFESKVSR